MNPIDLHSRPSLAAHVRCKIDPVSGDPVLLFPEGLLILNDTAQEIVSRCDGRRSVAEILRQLSDVFEVSEDILQSDLLEHLVQLQRRNLLVFAS